MILEYCGGGDLKDFLEDRGPLPEHLVQDIMTQLMSGLYYLEERGLVHRDIKPQNILLTDRSAYPTIKLADFGFAKQLEVSRLEDTWCGTPLYMAPEVISGKVKYTNKADLWSVGVIMYEMVSLEFYLRSSYFYLMFYE